MKTTREPITSWKSNSKKNLCCDKEVEQLLASCIEDETKNYTCLESGYPAADIVSIRCHRHKKRFNVEKSWLKTCKWLCPRCYDKLSRIERRFYAPKGESVGVRPAEEGKPIVYAKVAMQSENKKYFAYPRNKKYKLSVFSSNIVALLPTWRMKCKRCGKTVPVHKTYIDNNSSVLCPECFSKMTPCEVKEFCTRYPSSTAEIWQVECDKSRISNISQKSISKDSETQSMYKRTFATRETSSNVAAGGYYSNSSIFSMTVKELAEAVRLRKVSKARARIEMERRKKSDYFNNLPDVEPISLTVRY